MAILTDECINHERATMPLMNNQHWALTHEFDAPMRKSFLENVKPEYVQKIESWIGTDEQIQKALFWFKEGKFDDPQWAALQAVDDKTKSLWEAARKHFEALVPMAVKSQRLADLTLFSHFNPGLLYTGVAPAVRCDQSGAPDPGGGCFKGVEFRLIGSVPGQTDSITIWPLAGGASGEGYEVAFGRRAPDGFSGINVCAADFYSLKVLNLLMDKGLAKAGAESRLATRDGAAVELDKRAIAKSIRAKDTPAYGDELILFARRQVAIVEEALQTSDAMIAALYESFGLEREAFNLGRQLGNFCILRDSNFDEFIAGKRQNGRKGLVFLTATLVCRRCRREITYFYEWAKNHPHVVFVLVNLNAPMEPFYNRVFFDMGGPNFRNTAKGVTPFVIPYKLGPNSMEYCGEYNGTGKSDALTPNKDIVDFFAKHYPR